MQPLLNIAIRAARRAGDIIIRNINRVDSIKISFDYLKQLEF